MRRSMRWTVTFLAIAALASPAIANETGAKDPTPVVKPAESVASVGGPDTFGYTWIDSNEPDGPVFDWMDISGTGTSMGLSDDSYFFPIDLPWTFDFYGTGNTQIAVGSNGTVYFEDAYLGLANGPIPGTTAYTPQVFIAGYWDDLNPGAGGDVLFEIVGEEPNRMLIVQWQDVPHFGGDPADGVTYQVKLLEGSNNILVQYLDPSSEAGGGATEGIQGDPDPVVDFGLQYGFDQAILTADLAICYVHPLTGTVDPACSGMSEPAEPIVEIPTLSQVGLAVLVLLLLGASVVLMRRRAFNER